MAWDLSSISPFDLAELQGDVGFGIGFLPEQQLHRHCSVDLKLGGPPPPPPPPPLPQLRVPSSGSPSGAAKRARAPSSSGGGRAASCLVEGCKADLSKCRDYHRRHKVCEEHSKTQVVIVAGQQQRFCQQCSRFHLLVEFDEVKRSCRKRLDGHNRRRRKPQLDPMNPGSLFSNHQVAKFTSFPQIFTRATQEPDWSGMIKADEVTLFNHQRRLHLMDTKQCFSVSFAGCVKEEKPLAFLQNSGDTVCDSQHKPFSAPPMSTSTKMFSQEIAEPPLDSDCALSLLSSPVQTAAINVGQMVANEQIEQPLVPGIQYAPFTSYSPAHGISLIGFPSTGIIPCSGITNDHMSGDMISSRNALDTDLHSQGLFQITSEGSASTSHSMPFSWQ